MIKCLMWHRQTFSITTTLGFPGKNVLLNNKFAPYTKLIRNPLLCELDQKSLFIFLSKYLQYMEWVADKTSAWCQTLFNEMKISINKDIQQTTQTYKWIRKYYFFLPIALWCHRVRVSFSFKYSFQLVVKN